MKVVKRVFPIESGVSEKGNRHTVLDFSPPGMFSSMSHLYKSTVLTRDLSYEYKYNIHFELMKGILMILYTYIHIKCQFKALWTHSVTVIYKCCVPELFSVGE